MPVKRADFLASPWVTKRINTQIFYFACSQTLSLHLRCHANPWPVGRIWPGRQLHPTPQRCMKLFASALLSELGKPQQIFKYSTLKKWFLKWCSQICSWAPLLWRNSTTSRLHNCSTFIQKCAISLNLRKEMRCFVYIEKVLNFLVQLRKNGSIYKSFLLIFLISPVHCYCNALTQNLLQYGHSWNLEFNSEIFFIPQEKIFEILLPTVSIHKYPLKAFFEFRFPVRLRVFFFLLWLVWNECKMIKPTRQRKQTF